MTDSQELSGRVALVTGAGRNIGRAIALALAAGGASVAVNVRGNAAEADVVVKEITAKDGKAKAFIADIADAAAVEKMVAGAVAHFGRVDCLINNAALRREKPLDEMTYAEWREVMSVTLDGVFHCVKACLPQLKASGAHRLHACARARSRRQSHYRESRLSRPDRNAALGAGASASSCPLDAHRG